ncbi:MAG: tetratricopeptide repeat protein [Bacteroidetes bacterium]|nr:MAG: tetratricopeptide repeat protein [Bacteroidota bacterium]
MSSDKKYPAFDFSLTAEAKKWLGIVTVLTLIVYLPALKNGFVFWDDPEYVLHNPYIKDINLKELFSVFYMGNYHPLAMLSLAIDYQLFGFEPFGYHLHALILHLLNTVLVFLVFYHLFDNQKVFRAALIALLFGIHPMHVESVAWVSERKDVLYTFYFLLSYLFYVFYLRANRRSKFLIFSLIAFLLSCLAKGQAVVLSLVLVITDYLFQRKLTDKKVILEKIPFFILSLVFGIVAIKAQGEEAAINKDFYSGFTSIFYGSYGLLYYLLKSLVPYNLSGAHPYPLNEADLSMPKYFYIFPVLAAGIVFLVLKYFKNNRHVIFGFLFYLFTISIVLKLLPVGDTIVAERYTYVPYLGLFAVYAEWLVLLKNKFSSKAKLLKYAGVTVLGIYAVVTFFRIQVWKDTFVFWADVMEKYPKYWRAYNCVGQEYMQLGIEKLKKNNRKEAVADFENAAKYFGLAMKKDKWCPPVPYMLRGALYTDYLQDYPKAEKDFLKVLAFPNKMDPSQLSARQNLGLVYYRMKQYDKSLKYLNEALQINPNDPKTYYIKGLTLAAMKQPQKAIENYSKAIQLNPNYTQAYLNRGVVYTDRLNELEKGLQDFQKVLQLQPNNKDALVNTGVVYFKMNKPDKAIAQYNKALQLYPNAGRIYYLRALAYASKKDFKNALTDLQQAEKKGVQVPIQLKQQYQMQLKSR